MHELNEQQGIAELLSRLTLEHVDQALVARALRHVSYVREAGLPACESNERLEFLGDAVLDLLLADYVFGLPQAYPEGELTRLKSCLAQQGALARVAKRIDLAQYILLGRGEEETRGRHKASILAGAVEALIAAIYLSSGLEEARKFVLAHFAEEIHRALDAGPGPDPKTALQELIQEYTPELPEYKTIVMSGCDHEPLFRSECQFRGQTLGRGVGRTKREAEKAAALDALTEPDRVRLAVGAPPV